MIWIRADAGKVMGTGHVMRCLSIAAQLKKMSAQVCFLAADRETMEFLASKGVTARQELTGSCEPMREPSCEEDSAEDKTKESSGGSISCYLLGTDYREMESELPLLREILTKEPGPFLVDSYFTTPAYLQAVRELTFTACLDEDHRFPYPVDMIINYNIFGETMGYGKDPAEKEAKLLLGLSYAPLREQFLHAEYRVRQQAKKILITTGGADKYNLSGQILTRFLAAEEFAESEFLVVSGALNQYYEELKSISEKEPRVQLYRNVSNMAELMKECDLAVTAGGSTTYELCALGLPFLCFSFVDNQERIVRGFAGKKIVPFGGDYLADGEKMIEKLTMAAEELAQDFEKRQAQCYAQRSLVDGQGAARIAEELVNAEKCGAFRS